MKNVHPLYLKVDINPGESLFGYMIRIGELSGYAKLSDLMDRIGIARHQGDRTFQKIIHQLRKSVNDIAVCTNQDRNFLAAAAQTIAIGDVDYGLQRYCPKCLASRGYWRAIWESDLVRACGEHRVRLCSYCPKCGNTDLWRRPANLSCKCNFELQYAVCAEASDAEISIAVQAEEVIASGRLIALGNGEVLSDKVAFHEYCWLLRELFHLKLFHPVRYCSVTGNAPRISDGDYQTLCQSVAALLCGGRHKIVAELEFGLAEIPKSIRSVGRGLANAEWLFLMRRSQFPSSLQFLKDVCDGLNHSLAASRMQSMRSDLHEFESISSWLEFCDILGVDFTFVKMVLTSRIPSPDGSPQPFLDEFPCSPLLAKDVFDCLTHLVPLSLMPESLGLTRRHSETLNKSGLLNTYHLTNLGDQPHDDPRSVLAFFDRREAFAILEAFTSVASDFQSNASFLPLRKVLTGGRASQGYNIVRLVDDCRKGRVGVCLSDEGLGFEGFSFNVGDVDAILREETESSLSPNIRHKRDASHLSCAAADRLWGLTSGSTLQAIKLGLVSAIKVNPRTWGVDVNSMKEFMEKIITPKEIAKMASVAATTVSAKLLDMGITAIAGPGFTGPGCYMFKRADITQQVLTTLPTILEYGTRAGRRRNGSSATLSRPTDIVNASDAAFILNVKLQYFIHKLVAYGEISKVSVTDKLGKVWAGFSLTDIRRLAKKLGYEKRTFIELSAAARMLGETSSIFVRKWVQSGTLSLVEIRGEKMLYRKDMYKISQIRRNLVTANELAVITGVKVSYIRYLVRIGELVPFFAGVDKERKCVQFFDKETATRFILSKQSNVSTSYFEKLGA